jgi:hypothetical protein
MAIQVAGIAAAILLALPGFIDWLVRPLVCTGWCLDLRGLDFIVWAVFFTPPAAVLLGAIALLSEGRIWPAWLALGVDLAVLGTVAYAMVAGGGVRSYGETPIVFQVLQVLLVSIPASITLVLVLVLLNTPHGVKPDLLRITRNVLVAQVLAMAACLALAWPSMSDRLSHPTYGSEFRGLAFQMWAALLLPAGIAIIGAAWRLQRQRVAPILLLVIVNVLLIGVLGLTDFIGTVLIRDPQHSGVVQTQTLLVVVPAIASLVMVGLVNRARPRQRQPAMDSPSAR